MTSARVLPLALLLSAACAPAPTPPADAAGAGVDPATASAVTSEVHAASEALVEAMNAHDADSILTFYDLGPGFTYVGCTNFMFNGETFANILRGYHLANPEVRYDMAVQGVKVLGGGTAVVSLQGSSTSELDLFTTRVVQRDAGGRWRVVWEHESWPGCAAPTALHPGTAPGGAPGGAPSAEP